MSKPIQINIQISDVTNTFLLQIKDTTESVSRIFQSIENLSNEQLLHKPLPSDSFPVLIVDNMPKSTPKEMKEQVLNWAIRKGFEDFIIGLTKSFKETYKLLALREFALNQPDTLSYEEFEETVSKIEKEIEKFNVPIFISKIEKFLGKEVPLKKEICSINRVRNCLVHRHGVVSDRDISENENALNLYWLNIEYWTYDGDKKIPITFEVRKKGMTINNLSHKIVECSKSFSKNEEVTIDVNQFNGIATTCAEYANRIFELLPKENVD